MKNKRFKTAIGFILMPIVFCLFMVDRLVLVLLPHLKQEAIQNYFFDAKQISLSIYRIIGVAIVWALVYLVMLKF